MWVQEISRLQRLLASREARESCSSLLIPWLQVHLAGTDLVVEGKAPGRVLLYSAILYNYSIYIYINCFDMCTFFVWLPEISRRNPQLDQKTKGGCSDWVAVLLG